VQSATPQPAAAAPEAKEATVRFLKNRFRRHYSSAPLAPPPRIEQREFAFTDFEGTGMIRPIGFRGEDALRAWLKERAPAHAYHSMAYYKDPTVEHREKVWLGGDLIFDLDADHVRGAMEAAKSGGYAAMLALVKKEFQRLLDFLTSDLGYPPKEILIVFSGGRGYHAHVRDPRVVRLGSRERREIVDYITGRGLLQSTYLRQAGVEAGSEIKRGLGKGKTVTQKQLVDAPGWAHRLRTGHAEFLKLLTAMDPEDGTKHVFDTLKPQGLDPAKEKDRKSVRELLAFLAKPERAARFAESGNLDVLKDKDRETYLALLTAYRGIALEGETDEPVTSDTKRLIRLPGSLHGKSGLACLILAHAHLAEFDPLVEAVPEAFTDTPVKVEIVKPMSSILRGQRFDVKPGPAELPEFAAVFFAARGALQVKA
jgi:DNA primase small subunit